MTPINDHTFATCYMELCRQQRTRPLPMICVTMPHTLDFTTDRVKMDDWTPILNSLSLDRTLRSISMRSKYQCRKFLDQASSESKARAVSKAPVILTRYLIEELSHSLNQCVRNSSSLTSIELEGIPIPVDCLGVLCVGLAATKTLQHLSLQRCHIGDAGCELLCQKISGVLSIRSLNLSQCDLTQGAGSALASALSRQKLALYHDAWMQSLRYREPKLESMPGLRRLTLNGNNKLGDQAVTGIIDAVRDSLWLKALDLQQCGLTETTGQEILELLKHNTTLIVVDVRLNSGLREETQKEITRRLDENELRNGKSDDEYKWLNLPQSRESSKRVSSAGSLHSKQRRVGKDAEQQHELTRPRSAMIRQVKRPAPPVVYRKPLLAPMPQIVKRIKTKPPVPVFERRPRMPVKPLPEHLAPPQIATPPKVSLHLDLQSQIQSFADSSTQKEEPLRIEEQPIIIKEPPINIPDEDQTPRQPQTSEYHAKLEELACQLLEIRADRDRLQEEVARVERLLTEERSRREFAETKLRSAKRELEESLHHRERDSRGYLLISQKSMKELCLSFARLLEMLDSSDRNQPTTDEDDELVSLRSTEDIKRKFASIIRKTKSENLKRGYVVDEVGTRLQARYGSSEANIRSSRNVVELVQQPLTRIEMTTGDPGGATCELPMLLASYNGDAATLGKSGAQSPGERARAIFASVMNSDARLGFGSLMQ